MGGARDDLQEVLRAAYEDWHSGDVRNKSLSNITIDAILANPDVVLRALGGVPLLSRGDIDDAWVFPDRRVRRHGRYDMSGLAGDRDRVLAALADIYNEEGMAIWMRSANKLLGGRVPDEMIEQGDAERVLDLIAALADGAVM